MQNPVAATSNCGLVAHFVCDWRNAHDNVYPYDVRAGWRWEVEQRQAFLGYIEQLNRPVFAGGPNP
jgi:hypothetical protein